MPHEMVPIRSDVIKERGLHKTTIKTSYEAPADGDGNVADDPYREFDLEGAKRIMLVLSEAYPGHLWRVVSDIAQGIVKISIPILMGINKQWYVINLHKTPLNEGVIKIAGGELLERYGLGRGRFEIGSFLEARAKHSILVMPNRKVPG